MQYQLQSVEFSSVTETGPQLKLSMEMLGERKIALVVLGLQGDHVNRYTQTIAFLLHLYVHRSIFYCFL